MTPVLTWAALGQSEGSKRSFDFAAAARQRHVVALKWDTLTEPEPQANTIEAFFATQGGNMLFLSALRGDVLRQWTCEE
jgi:hypothetical protein